MTPAEIIYHRRVRLLSLADELGNVSRACRQMGISRTRYYEWRDIVAQYGLEALNRALRLFGMEISRADHLTTFDGLPTRRKLEMLTVTEGLPKELHGFLNDLKQAYTLELVSSRCRPTFGHEFALARLKARGIKLAVASNSVRNTVVTMMDRANLANLRSIAPTRTKEKIELLLEYGDEHYGKEVPDPYGGDEEGFVLAMDMIEDGCRGLAKVLLR